MLGPQPRQMVGGVRRDLDLVEPDEAIERRDDPRVEDRARRPTDPRQRAEGDADLRIPEDLEPQPQAVDPVSQGQARRRRVVADLDRRQAPLGAGVQAGRALLAQWRPQPSP